MRFCTVLGLLFTTLLASCGGGGSGSSEKEVLVVSLSYPDAQLTTSTLRVPISVAPAITGLKNYTPHCALVGGALPGGVAVQDNCTISGTPLSGGSFYFKVRLTADNAEGFVESDVNLLVFDPTPIVSVVRGQVSVQNPRVTQQITWNEPLANVQVAINSYGDQTTEQVSYAIVSGALPAGLMMNSTTGRLTGTPTVLGIASFDITVTLRRGTISYASAPQTVTLYVSPVMTRILYGACPPADWAVAWSCTPSIQNLPAGASLRFSMDFLPELFSVDPITGTISGAPEVPDNYGPQSVALVTLTDGETYLTYGIAYMSTEAPTPTWGSDLNIRLVSNQPFAFVASTPVGGLPGDTYRYAIEPDPANPLANWILLDPLTGRLSGTPPATTVLRGENFQIRLTTTRNGKTTTSGSYFWQLLYE